MAAMAIPTLGAQLGTWEEGFADDGGGEIEGKDAL